MKGQNDDLVMSLAIGCWIAESNSPQYNTGQIEMADSLLQGMKKSNTKINNTNNTPFYNNKQMSVNPFVPVILPKNKFGSDEITRKDPMGDLRWLIGK